MHYDWLIQVTRLVTSETLLYSEMGLGSSWTEAIKTLRTWCFITLFNFSVDLLLPPLAQALGLTLVDARVPVPAVHGQEIFALPGLLVEVETTLLATAQRV